MPAPLSDEKRAAILDAIKAGGKRNEIARAHGVGAGTVTKIAQEAGIAFDRSVTKNATEAKKADNAALRASTSRRLLVKANEFLDQMDAEHVAFNFGGKDNTYNEKRLPRPPVSDLRNLMTAAAVAIDKHLVIEKHDSGTGAEQAASLLGAMFADMQERHGATPAE
ncbi:hypothetical protein [Streptosporangium sp. NPDC006930]|uniref:hypothetical protein n=1 Tax=Streptosporangium sp. NPDC006930 TaxID=3154783 RepID=UPI00343C4997